MTQTQTLGEFQAARAIYANNELTVTTGRVRRTWRWTGRGFATVALGDETTGYAWPCRARTACDWALPGQTDDPPEGELLSLSADRSDDEGFTAPHLSVAADIRYPAQGLVVRFLVWAYPDACGLRTQLAIRAEPSRALPWDAITDRVETLPVDPAHCSRRFLGYYNDTQHRNDTHLDLLHEVELEHGANPLAGTVWNEWASVLCLEDAREGEGLCLVKESHKCVNQHGHDTGHFRLSTPGGVQSTGWGVLPQEVIPDRFRFAWAHWTVLYAGGDDERERALKSFDRVRYPLDPQRDIYILANIWGGGELHAPRRSRDLATADVVRSEIDSQADLGIDVQQVDDGWQVPPAATAPGKGPWTPDAQRFPGGWGPLAEYARERGVKLGLWAAAQDISLEELIAAWEEGGFVQYKLDFVQFGWHGQIEELMGKVRQFVRHTGHGVRVNWDVTENDSRFGYWFGREYGSVYLSNRRAHIPPNVAYRPHTMLRDVWQLAKYVNLHRFQLTVQNPALVNPALSDASTYPADYCTAIALMGTPLLFTLTQNFTGEVRDNVRRLLAAYRSVREELYGGIVYPIGDRPDGANWAGFQCVCGEGARGYLLLFREPHSELEHGRLRLRFIRDTTLTLTNLLTGAARDLRVEPDGEAVFHIPERPGYRLLRYEVQ